MEIKVRISNLNEVMAALKSSPVIVTKHINDAIKRSIFDIRNTAIPKTPVATGRLKGSYVTKFGILRGEVQPMTNYAYWVEVMPYRHRVGQSHYLRGGVEEVSGKINDRFKTGLSDALSEIARSAGGH